MTLQLELGKKYLNCRGEVVEIVLNRGDLYTYCYEDSTGLSYTPIGEYYEGDFNMLDLVKEYVESSTEQSNSAKVSHVHKDLIIAWAQGEIIEYLEEEDGEFYQVHGQPSWDVDTTYRVKPEKKVEVVSAWVSRSAAQVHVAKPNLSLTFEDGKLIKAEVL